MRRTIRAALCLLALCGGLSAQTIVKSSGGASNVGDLGDVTLTSKTDGDGLRVDASGDFINTALFTPTTTDFLAARMSANVQSALETAVTAAVLNLDGGFEVVDFRCTGVAGVLTCQDPTPGTGITTFNIDAGAGQGAAALLQVRDASAAAVFDVSTATGQLGAFAKGLTVGFNRPVGTPISTGFIRLFDGSSVEHWRVGTAGTSQVSDATILWSNSTSALTTMDTGIARDAAAVIRGTDGSTGYGQFYAKSFRTNPDGTARPTCDVTARGTYWQTYGGAGVADTVAVCAKSAADAYDWRTIY